MEDGDDQLMVEPAAVEALLGVPPGYPPWRVADMARRARIQATWLSSAQARGVPISTVAREYLARVRRRVADLHAVGAEMSAAHDVRVIKGARIAALMPDGLLRESGDADLVARDEQSLWACVLDIRKRYDAAVQGVSVMQAEGSMHLLIAMKWPAVEQYLDKPMGADISTCAFSGDFKSVPIRAEAPDDDDLCSLFAVSEERFQRRFRRKDMLDLAVIGEALAERYDAELPELVLGLARELCLAPELRQLIRKTSRWLAMPPVWSDIAERLEGLAGEEKKLRAPGRTGVHRLRFGLPLDARASPGLAVGFETFGGGELLRTPVGTCLLVDSPVVPSELYEAGLAAAQRIGVN
jgi:hypothetical protein